MKQKDEGEHSTGLIAQKTVNVHEQFYVAFQHARLYQAMYGVQFFNGMRKHLGSYCRDFSGAKALREKMIRTSNVAEVEALIKSFRDEALSAAVLERLTTESDAPVAS